MSVTSAIEIIRRQRPQIEIAPQYMNLLDVWAARFSLLGAASLCVDCAASARAVPKKKVQFLGVGILIIVRSENFFNLNIGCFFDSV